jgi:hypothetical protein
VTLPNGFVSQFSIEEGYHLVVSQKVSLVSPVATRGSVGVEGGEDGE